MPTRHSFYGRGPVFIVDQDSISRLQGRQIDWPNVPSSFIDAQNGKKVIPAGTIMVENNGANGAQGQLVPRANRLNTETASMLLATQAVEGEISAAMTGYGVIVGGVIFDNLLPDSANASFATFKTELAAASTGFRYDTYADTRGS